MSPDAVLNQVKNSGVEKKLRKLRMGTSNPTDKFKQGFGLLRYTRVGPRKFKFGSAPVILNLFELKAR